jgi:hypothetical protein
MTKDIAFTDGDLVRFVFPPTTRTQLNMYEFWKEIKDAPALSGIPPAVPEIITMMETGFEWILGNELSNPEISSADLLSTLASEIRLHLSEELREANIPLRKYSACVRCGSTRIIENSVCLACGYIYIGDEN